MIKIKAKLDIENEKLDWKYKGKKTCVLENMCVIWNIIENLLLDCPELDEEEIMDMIKNRKKYMNEIGGNR